MPPGRWGNRGKGMEDEVPRPSLELVRRILHAGVEAGRLALETGQDAVARSISRDLERIWRGGEIDTEDLVGRIVRAHVKLARAEGAGAGVTTTVAEATTVVGTAGTLTVPTVVAITAADLTGLLWIQLRMTLTIAAIYGHDPSDPARVREFMSLQGALPAAGAGGAARYAAAATGRVSSRLINRHLRGPLLASITALFRSVGIKFSRAALLRQLFLLNIPMNAIVNDAVTRRLAQKARDYYRTLPAPPREAEPSL